MQMNRFKLLALLSLLLLAAFSPQIVRASLEIEVFETGKLYLSADGAGSNFGGAGGAITQVNKPSSTLTVRKAFLACATVPGRDIKNGDVQLDGNPVSWSKSVLNAVAAAGVSFENVFADVTSIVKPKTDSAPPGRINFVQTENDINPAVGGDDGIDGCALYTIFDDSSFSALDRSVVILFGEQNVDGDDFSLTLLESPQLTDPLDFGIAASFSTQGGTTGSHECGTSRPQFSILDVNGSRLTSCAGNSDDGQPTGQAAVNGRLITVGGLDDATTNPGNPFQEARDGTTPRTTDDELYTLRPFLTGSNTFIIETVNPSDDDNIFAGHFFMPPTVLTLNAGLTATPNTGAPPLSVALTARRLAGNSTGTLNYNFWWNCNDPAISVAAATDACGAPDFRRVGLPETTTSYSPTTQPPPYSSGTHRPKVIIEQGFASGEARATVTVDTLLPDLTVDTLTRTPVADVVAGDSMSFSGTVRNIGQADVVDDYTTRLEVISDTNDNGVYDYPLDDTVITFDDNIRITNLAKDDSYTETFAGAWTAAEGTYWYRICADYNGEVYEGGGVRDNNNCAISDLFTVSPALGVTLTTDKSIYIPDENVQLIANVTGGPPSVISNNFSFWWHCPDSTGTIDTVAEAVGACGNLPSDAPGGSCTFDSVGAKCNGVTSAQQVVSHAYAAASTYSPKVVVEKASYNATDNETVMVTALPTVDIKVNGVDGPITIPAGSSATLDWTSVNTIGGTCTASGDWTGSKSVPNGMQLTGIINSQKTYTLKCTNSSGIDSAPDSVTVNVLSAPSGLTASTECISENPRVNLNWVDNSDNENGFKVHRSGTSGFTPTSPGNEIGSVGGTSFTDTSVNSGNTYYYKVRSFISSPLLYSTPSNQAFVVVPSCTLVVNGVCGSANGIPSSSQPGSGLCSAGTASSVSGGGGSPWMWTCNGSGGGSNASCSAPYQPPAGGGSFTLSKDRDIEVNFSPTLTSRSNKVKITVHPLAGFNEQVDFSINQLCNSSGTCTTNPSSMIFGFQEIFEPTSLAHSGYSSGTLFSVRVNKSAADPKNPKAYTVYVKGVSHEDSGNHYILPISLTLNASDPGIKED